MMPTDEDRREVARIMRSQARGEVFFDDELVREIIGAEFMTSDRAWGMLADLIDPGIPDTSGQCPKSRPEMSGIDRDALQALAEDVRGYCIERQITPWVAGHIYDRIREALGVE